MKKKLSLSLVLGILILGCATFNTFNKQVVLANSLVEEASATVAPLYNGGKLSLEEKDKANQHFKEVAASIDAVVYLHQTQPDMANNQLGAIIFGLQTSLNLLQKQEKRP